MKPDSRSKSYGHVPNPYLVGFESEIQILLHHLQPHDKTHVVGIVGQGGSGKTTLAKHIYHHSDINSHFARKVWICISQSLDKTSVLNAIWRQATKDPQAPKMDEDQVIDCLSELLCSKSYLVVLDDIWDINAWNHISPALPKGNGSKVVITTRNQILPRNISPNVVIVKPKQLKDEESYELFKRTTSPWNESIPEKDMLQLGMQMVKKCKGLPLAIIALAGVLRKDKTQTSWERITGKMLNLENESTQGVVKKILALSYDELPHHLKLCARYLHVFPEDYRIKAQTLIQMWIAERFMEEESVAQEYLDELAQRCIVEVVKTNCEGQVCQVQVHDLIRAMFIDIDKERCSLTNPVLRLVPRTTLYGDEHKSCESRKEVLVRYLYGSSNVRSLIFLNFPDLKHVYLQPLFIKLKLLRVLVLDYIVWVKLPEEIGNLIHLRYLKISGHRSNLPASIGKLENLQTLDIWCNKTCCSRINLEKLKELRHLYLLTNRFVGGDFEVMGLEVMGFEVMGLQKMKKLKTLLVQGGEWMLSVMPQLNDFLQVLYVKDIQKQECLEVVFTTPSITLNNLHTLELQWIHFSSLRDMGILSKCTSLKKLKLDGKIEEGTQIMLPPNLIQLEMQNTCIEDEDVLNKISKSCPHLKILGYKNEFSGPGKKEIELVCNKNSFPQLEKLVLINSDLKLWIIERGAMPRLSHLIIDHCYPGFNLNDEGWERIPHIPKLALFKFIDVASPFGEKLKQCRKDWKHCIKHPEDYRSETELD